LKKPLIGINPYDIDYKSSMWNATKEAYYQAVWRNGGCPVTLSHTNNANQISSLVSNIDSLLMVGGPDVPAKTYKSKNPQLLDPDIMSDKREAFDRAIFLETMNQNKKILAICAGVQHANVILGGTLIEDIPTLIKNHINHGVFNGAANTHRVNTTNKDSLLYSIVQKESFSVKSSHHQCINIPGKEVVITAKAEDGAVEAIEIAGRNNFIGVQWHPEIMPKSENMKKLFSWLSS
jgi:putative glutamine amidotransferase|tara:strand:+ start:951 stop:1655 length:705 start_codon:yes stop_codon:yes gene_type:complete